jgi:hypothetical protein
MILEAILARLQAVRHSGEGWIARCPAHEDRNPSLSIRESNGKILLHCFAGCMVDAVCAALGIAVRDLFEKPGNLHRRAPDVVRYAYGQIKGLRSRLTPTERERSTTVVLASRENLDPAIARALALAVEGEIVQVTLKENRV